MRSYVLSCCLVSSCGSAEIINLGRGERRRTEEPFYLKKKKGTDSEQFPFHKMKSGQVSSGQTDTQPQVLT